MREIALQLASFKALVPLSLVGIARAARWKRTVSTFKAKRVTHMYVGKPLTLNICDPVAQAWYDRDCPDLDELGGLIRMGALEAKMKVFVLGAHQGVVSLVVSRFIDPAGKVVAVEGTRFNVGVGTGNIDLNGASNVTLLHAVVGSSPGSAEFVSVGNGYLSRGKKEQTEIVESVSLDSLAERFGDPDFVFLDVEGVEYIALQHSDLVRRKTAAWDVELHGDADIGHYGGSNAAVVRLFREHGYLIDVLGPDNRFTRLDPHASVTSERTHIYCKPAV